MLNKQKKKQIQRLHCGPISPFPHRKQSEESHMHMPHALLFLFCTCCPVCWKWQRRHANMHVGVYHKTINLVEWILFEFTQKHLFFHSHPKTSPWTCPKITCSFRKRQKQFGSKTEFEIVEKHVENVVEKILSTSGKTKSHINQSKFTCKCEACSKWVSQTKIVACPYTSAPNYFAYIMQSPENHQKHLDPRCDATILHHIRSWTQPSHRWHQKKAARPNSHWVIAHVHHMHGSVYFHTPFCYELPVRQLPSSEAQSSHVACKYVSSHPPTIVRISTKSSLHVGCRCFQITYVR